MERPIQNGSNAVRKGAGRAMKRRRGFTFVELMVVITIIVILISMAIPIYNRSIIRAKESVLANNLYTLRTVIDQYSYDKGKAPQQLQDLVTEGYLQKLPVDPITGQQPDLAHRDGRSQPERVAIRARHLRREERLRQNGFGRSCVFREVTPALYC